MFIGHRICILHFPEFAYGDLIYSFDKSNRNANS